jgi:demethylmenaquinone methyltransferase/2-methoxy-6-polyprenyl-1,4-benzoquinol methylase
MAVYLSRLAKGNTMILAADFSIPMIQKAILKPEAQRITFVLADAKALPFREKTFDLLTISFATRNLNLSRDVLLSCFRGFYDVLRPAGRFVNLETSQPSSPLIRRLFHLFVRLTVRPLGYRISGSRSGYAYLSYTIPRFYGAQELAAIIRKAGFSRVWFHRLMLGAVAIHKAVK